MSKIVGFTAELKDIDCAIANIGVCKTQRTEDTFLLSLAFEAIIKCMKDCNRKAFYAAMADFVDETEYKDAHSFFEDMTNE